MKRFYRCGGECWMNACNVWKITSSDWLLQSAVQKWVALTRFNIHSQGRDRMLILLLFIECYAFINKSYLKSWRYWDGRPESLNSLCHMRTITTILAKRKTFATCTIRDPPINLTLTLILSYLIVFWCGPIMTNLPDRKWTLKHQLRHLFSQKWISKPDLMLKQLSLCPKSSF